MEKLNASDLRLGDVVRLSPLPFADAIVCKVTPEFVSFFRPYGRSDDFSYGDPPSVICLTGVETFSVFKSTHQHFEVLSRKDIS